MIVVRFVSFNATTESTPVYRRLEITERSHLGIQIVVYVSQHWTILENLRKALCEAAYQPKINCFLFEIF